MGNLFRKFFVDKVLRKQVNQRFHYRDLLEVIRKREDFKLKLLEAEKSSIDDISINKYKNYLDVLNWIIKDDTTRYYENTK